MKRDDWLDRLWETIDAHKFIAFEYGVHDCCTFVATCLDAMHGSERLKKILVEYHDEKTAKALIKSKDGMLGVVEYFLGKSKPPHAARRGDPVLVESLKGTIVGICIGDAIVCAGDGVETYPLHLSRAAWCIDG